MPLYLPDFSEIMAVAETRGDASDAPHLWRGLVGAWPMQEPGGVKAFDVSGYGVHLAPANTRGVGIYGRTLTPTGTSSVTLPTRHPLANLAYTDEFSVAVLGGTASGDVKSSFMIRSGGVRSYFWWRQPSGYVYFYGVGDGAQNARTTITYAVGEQLRCIGVYTSRRPWLYIPGCPIAAGNQNVANTSTTNTIEWAANELGSQRNVWRRVLTEAERREWFADPWAMYRLRTVVFPAAVAEEPDIPSGSGTIDATGSLEGTGWRASEASGSIEATAAIVGVGYATADGAGTLNAAAEITAAGYRASEGTGTLDAVAAITGTGYTVAEGAGTLDAVAGIVGVGEAPLIVPTGSGSIVGVAEIEGTGYRTSSGHASLDAVGSILATGYASHIGSGVIEAVAIMAGVGRTPLETINTPASRTRTVRAEDRTRIVRREDRTLVA